MSATVSPSHSIAVPTVATALLPIMAAVSLAFLVIGVALPVLPLHVHQKLGLSTFVVGLITGTQFLAALMSRVWAGRFADRAGAKRAVVVGLLTAVAGGLLYLLSLLCVATPAVSAGILLLLILSILLFGPRGAPPSDPAHTFGKPSRAGAVKVAQ